MDQLPVSVFGPLAVVLAVAVALGALAVFHRFVNKQDLREGHDVAGFVYAVVGVIYAVILAFVVIIVWEQFDDADKYCQDEASHIGDLRRYAEAFPDSVDRKIEWVTLDYMQSVVKREWPAMERGEEDSATYRKMVEIWHTYREFRPAETEEAYYQESLKQLAAFNDARRLRILASRGHIPPIMWALLIAGGVIAIGFTFLFAAPKRWPQFVTVACLTAIIAMTLILINALDRPFSGEVKVQPDAFEYLIERANVR